MYQPAIDNYWIVVDGSSPTWENIEVAEFGEGDESKRVHGAEAISFPYSKYWWVSRV